MSEENIFLKLAEKSSKKAKAKRKYPVYVNQEDGLEYCCNCHTRTQQYIEIKGVKKIMNHLCKCLYKEKEEEQKAHKKMILLEKRKTMRSEAFPEKDMKNWTFDKDDKSNVRVTNAMKKYLENFDTFKKSGKGLLLWGEVGTGKTFMAACIVNALIDNDIPCLMTSFTRICNTLQGMFEGKQIYIDSLKKYKLIVIDDLGVERNSEYVLEQVYNVIDARYRSGLPMIITTNLFLSQIKDAKSIEYERIYDRILERCHPIKIEGESKRQKKVKESYFETKDILGM